MKVRAPVILHKKKFLVRKFLTRKSCGRMRFGMGEVVIHGCEGTRLEACEGEVEMNL